MGKKRIAELMQQLEREQQVDIKNAAGIYAVAQVAVHQLSQQSAQEPNSNPVPDHSLAPFRFNPSLELNKGLKKSELLARYGSYQNCRRAAKDLGLHFTKTPSWEQLGQALHHAETLQYLVNQYFESYPTTLPGVSICLPLSQKV
jgi:hypothetical protein